MHTLLTTITAENMFSYIRAATPSLTTILLAIIFTTTVSAFTAYLNHTPSATTLSPRLVHYAQQAQSYSLRTSAPHNPHHLADLTALRSHYLKIIRRTYVHDRQTLQMLKNGLERYFRSMTLASQPTRLSEYIEKELGFLLVDAAWRAAAVDGGDWTVPFVLRQEMAREGKVVGGGW